MKSADHIISQQREIPSQHGEKNQEVEQGELYVNLNSQQAQVTPSEILETVQCFQAQLQCFKEDNLKSIEEQHEINVQYLRTVLWYGAVRDWVGEWEIRDCFHPPT